ncbi:hypothetical protein NCS57_01230100 [Fusarium keratoplasticum]|uniref:Uncharacterized protein n=1 Tax=Fusarium keratoplasticum TaxID=1328300 RepID=A0ACC0QIK0_9HYPO|nr:hypothetical protein NCS57_01230100 [Fusarium keratoplasticum]KAI8654830.1 hypothetical protein NCS57_01230100 [Fusarium keratoplasticum]
MENALRASWSPRTAAGKCHPPIADSLWLISRSAPLSLEGNVKDFIDTMAYIDMVIKLNSPSRRQERILDTSVKTRTNPTPTNGFGFEDRVLLPGVRKDLVVATITLGTRFIEIIAEHATTHGDRQVKCSHDYPTRLTTSNVEYLSWNGAVREFHADVLKALQPVNDHLARTIMENIPIKWIPAVDEEALEAAKMAILKADPPAQF